MASVTRVAALSELEIVSGEISSLHLQLAELIAAELEAKTAAWFQSDAQYVSERDRIADFNSLHVSVEVIKLRGELAAQESRRSFLEFVVHWGAE